MFDWFNWVFRVNFCSPNIQNLFALVDFHSIFARHVHEYRQRAQRILGVIWGVTEVKWNLIDFYIGFWGFKIDGEKKGKWENEGKKRAVYASQIGKFNLSLRLNWKRDTWENLSWVGSAIFIISTCGVLHTTGWERWTIPKNLLKFETKMNL